MTLAEEHQQAAEIALDHFREMFILAFKTMTDGLPKQFRAQARTIIAFFETETNAATWERLKLMPDPDTMIPDPMTGMVDPTKVRTLADSWLDQWAHLNRALGKEDAA